MTLFPGVIARTSLKHWRFAHHEAPFGLSFRASSPGPHGSIRHAQAAGPEGHPLSGRHRPDLIEAVRRQLEYAPNAHLFPGVIARTSLKRNLATWEDNVARALSGRHRPDLIEARAVQQKQAAKNPRLFPGVIARTSLKHVHPDPAAYALDALFPGVIARTSLKR